MLTGAAQHITHVLFRICLLGISRQQMNPELIMETRNSLLRIMAYLHQARHEVVRSTCSSCLVLFQLITWLGVSSPARGVFMSCLLLLSIECAAFISTLPGRLDGYELLVCPYCPPRKAAQIHHQNSYAAN